MIDKRLADHREGLHNPISTEIIEALTVTGGPCEGIRPYTGSNGFAVETTPSLRKVPE